MSRELSTTCLAGPAWEASDAGRALFRSTMRPERAAVAARAILASADLLREGGWSSEQVRSFLLGLLEMES